MEQDDWTGQSKLMLYYLEVKAKEEEDVSETYCERETRECGHSGPYKGQKDKEPGIADEWQGNRRVIARQAVENRRGSIDSGRGGCFDAVRLFPSF